MINPVIIIFHLCYFLFLKSKNPYVLRRAKNEETGKLYWHRDLKSNLLYKEKYKAIFTKRMVRLSFKRENKINDYIYKASNMIIRYALDNDIKTIVLGYSSSFQKKGFQKSDNYDNKSNYEKHIEKMIIKENNQKFLSIPFGKLKSRLEYLTKAHDIYLVMQEESYSSASSFYDMDDIPVYDKDNNIEYKFSGERIKRGLYKCKDGKLFNADVNGALNILRKSSVCGNEEIELLRRRGANTPMRQRVA